LSIALCAATNSEILLLQLTPPIDRWWYNVGKKEGKSVQQPENDQQRNQEWLIKQRQLMDAQRPAAQVPPPGFQPQQPYPQPYPPYQQTYPPPYQQQPPVQPMLPSHPPRTVFNDNQTYVVLFVILGIFGAISAAAKAGFDFWGILSYFAAFGLCGALIAYGGALIVRGIDEESRGSIIAGLFISGGALATTMLASAAGIVTNVTKVFGGGLSHDDSLSLPLPVAS
jgi:hypothetical protein